MTDAALNLLVSAGVSIVLGLIGVATTIIKVRGKADQEEITELRKEIAECHAARAADQKGYAADREQDRVNYVRERDVLLAESQRLNGLLMDLVRQHRP